MRHPIWKWTGWLSWLGVGLSGCLHGQDWRAAVSKPLTRPVVDQWAAPKNPFVVGPLRQDQRTFVPPSNVSAANIDASLPAHTPVPRFVGQRRSPPKTKVPAVGHITPSAITASPPALTASGTDRLARSTAEAIQPATIIDEAQPRGAKVLEAEFIPPPVPPAAPSPSDPPDEQSAAQITAEAPPVIPVIHAPPPTKSRPAPTQEGFAEFERMIPLRKAEITREPAPWTDDEEIAVAQEIEPITPQPLPLIIPSGATRPVHRPLASQSVPLASVKELPDVPDTTITASDSSNADPERIVRPRDVAVLVEQVFEDLRQRRLDQARQRTAWLKQVVSRRESDREMTSATKQASVSSEPQRLRADLQAAPLENTPTRKILDDDEFKNRP